MIPDQERLEDSRSYQTPCGTVVHRSSQVQPYARAGTDIVSALDSRRGVWLASSFEYPGRYTRWDIGFVDPPIEIVARERALTVRALNARGRVLLPVLEAALGSTEGIRGLEAAESTLSATVPAARRFFPEEARSRQPSVFTALRSMLGALHDPDEPYLGLYGAFGYDLTFQFDPIRPKLPRNRADRDLVLYLPDEILVVDHRRSTARRYRYDFEYRSATTTGKPRAGAAQPYRGAGAVERSSDHQPGEYADAVRTAREHFRRGDLFEVVPGQTFFEPCPAPPSAVFRLLAQRNPAPYGALINLGDSEYLIAASPEMYVRVEGRRIETCPISGTIARGSDALEDAARIFELLASEKEASELTMCTDVDRNDKSRVCVPGSVEVIGRRQIEMYSRLIHTVDHVVGELDEGFDALDGFLAHTWAVTVTGAPKHAAMQFIEDHERSPRRWYGGAIGVLGFDGNMNTGLTLRTVRLSHGMAEVRAGATLLFDSDPQAEEAETHLKASALLDAIRSAGSDARVGTPAQTSDRGCEAADPGRGLKILMVDHQDSFVHTRGGYLRETGAAVVTLRSSFAREALAREGPDLVVLSPGPGTPEDFGLRATIAACLDARVAIFGVCLGLQGLVECFGGRLGTLDYPVHGKPSEVCVLGGRLFRGLPERFVAGRYHSLFADRTAWPQCLTITAETGDGIVMAIEHRERPIDAVQFHPESILSLGGGLGRRLIGNVVRRTAELRAAGTAATPLAASTARG